MSAKLIMMKILPTLRLFGVACLLLMSTSLLHAQSADARFDQLAKDFVDEFPALSPVSATGLGDHRFDDQLDEVSAQARTKSLSFYRGFSKRLGAIPREALSRDRQVDAALLKNRLEYRLWSLETLQEWAWNPLVYTQLSGGAIYGLVAREFAPVEQRLNNVSARLEQMPRLFSQVRETLVPSRVPRVHAETAIKQNRGILSILDNMVVPFADALNARDRQRLNEAMAVARTAVEEHEQWLKETLLPAAQGDFRVGADLFDTKLRYTLHTPLTRQQVKERAESEFDRVRREMYDVSKRIYLKQHPYTVFPENPDEDYRQAIIRSALEITYLDMPGRDEIVSTATAQVEEATQFVIDHEIVSVMPDPLEVIIMPEFRRGVSVAYCDSPGPLDTGLKTYYAVSPLPEDWTDEQVRSFLREYNIWSMHDLTMHEAVPGHFLQLAHSNRYPSTLRAILSSGPFIEGWAVYSERVDGRCGVSGGR